VSARVGEGLALECLDVSKHFGGVKAVNGATVSVERGAIVSLIGPNGAGKTTLFNTITGMYPVTDGRIVFHDPGGAAHTITNRRPDKITRLGIARTFQNIRLFKAMSVLDNVKIGLHPRTKCGVVDAVFPFPWRMREEREITDACLEYLAFVGLAGHEADEAGSLAYGEQRALEIARALATHPSLLLLDEPAAGLNPTETATLMALIRKIRSRGITVLLIEHDMRLVMEISEHIYVLDHGEIICEGGPEKVRCDPQVIEAYLGQDITQTEQSDAEH